MQEKQIARCCSYGNVGFGFRAERRSVVVVSVVASCYLLLVLLGILRVVKSHVGTSTKSAKSPDSMQRMSQINPFPLMPKRQRGG